MQSFKPAKMCSLIFSLTVVLLALPVGFAVAAIVVSPVFWLPVLFTVAIFALIWFRFRPSRFVVGEDALEIHWPLKRVDIPIGEVSDVRQMGRVELSDEIGWGLRIGAGGLWGGFGWLWTKRRGIIQMYITRLDSFVWIERGGHKPLLITPERPDEFVSALMHASENY